MKKISKHLLIGIGIIILGLIIYVSCFHWIDNKSWPNWTGFKGKTLWDFLEILVVPIFLAIIAIVFNILSNKNSNRIADNRTQDYTLRNYLDDLSHFLLEEDIYQTDDNSPIRQLLRAKTLTALHQLNGERKGILIRFIYHLGLINKNGPLINLSGADLKSINLSGADHSDNKDRTLLNYLSLFEVSFAGAEMREADFSEAKLSRSNFMFTDLTDADFGDAHLMESDFRFATLKNVNFNNASLLNADLSGTKGMTKNQLRKSKTYKAATLPDHLNEDENKD